MPESIRLKSLYKFNDYYICVLTCEEDLHYRFQEKYCLNFTLSDD